MAVTQSIPTRMRAAQLTAAEKLDVVEIPTPEPGPGDVLVEIAAAGVCGSDLHAWHGHHPFRRPPVILGHEGSGTIAAVGEGVDPARVGERVVFEPQRVCGECEHCRAGRNQLCVARVLPGMDGWTGTIADYFLMPARMCYPIPDSLDLELAAIAEPLAVAVHAARRAGVEAGTTVNVIGAGTIGTLVASVCRSWGAEVGLVTDIDPEKLAFLDSLGLARPVDVRDGGLWTRDHVAEGTAAAVTVVAATAPRSVVEASALTRPGGTILLLGLYGAEALFDASRLVTAEQRIVASVTYDTSDFRAAIELLSADPAAYRRLITRRIGLAELEEEFRAQSAKTRFTVKTLIIPEGR